LEGNKYTLFVFVPLYSGQLSAPVNDRPLLQEWHPNSPNQALYRIQIDDIHRTISCVVVDIKSIRVVIFNLALADDSEDNSLRASKPKTSRCIDANGVDVLKLTIECVRLEIGCEMAMGFVPVNL
jgi:hypothetical protein